MPSFYCDDTFGGADEATLATSGENVAVAALSNGGYVTSFTVGNSIYVQRYDVNGIAQGARVLVGVGSDAAITGTPGGGFAVSWVGSSPYVSTRVFNADGTAATSVFGAGIPSNYQQQPTIATLSNGDIVVAWTFNGSPSSIRAQIFHADGQAVTGELALSAGQTNKYYPQIAALSGGGFVVSWSSGSDGGGPTVFAQSYDNGGAPHGSLVRVPNIVSYHDNFFQSVAALTTGGYVMTWTEQGDSMVTSKVMSQVYAADGTTFGASFQVNTAANYNSSQANVTAVAGGGFLVTWKLDVPGSGPNYFQIGDVMAQLFNGQGQRIGTEFLVNQATANGQDLPVAIGFGTGDIALHWRSFNSFGQSSLQSRTLYSATNGTELNDVFNGTVGIDYIRGFAGDDSISGSDGDDVIDGGTGDDTLIGGNGADTIDAGGGSDIIYTGNFGGPWSHSYYYIDPVIPMMDRGVERDIVQGGAGLDTIYAGYGDNVDGGADGAHLLISFMGSASGVVFNGSALVNGGSVTIGGGLIQNIASIQLIEGTNSADTISASSFGQTSPDIFGFGGDDILNGGAFWSNLYGGDGNDTLSNLNSVYGGYLYGEAGDDTIYTEKPTSAAFGGEGNDTIIGEGRAYGGNGNDTLRVAGSYGATYGFYGDAGDDRIFGANGIDNLYGGDGLDEIHGGGGGDLIDGGTGVNALFGDAGNDTLIVGSGADGTSVDGGADSDTLVVAGSVALGGLASIETIILQAATLTLTAAQFTNGVAASGMLDGVGTLTVNMAPTDLELYLHQLSIAGGSNVTITVNGSTADDAIKGVLQASNTINGGSGNDQIRGGARADIINGGDGDDKIIGAGGADILTGGAGADVFRYQAVGNSGVGAAADRITDFVIGTDRLGFTLIDTDPVAPGDQGFAFIGSAAFGATGAAQMRFMDSGADLLVQADVNGDGIADMEIVLQGLAGQTLTSGDFLL